MYELLQKMSIYRFNTFFTAIIYKYYFKIIIILL